MSITSSDLQNLIITTLSDADAGILSGLRAVVPQYWLLWNRQGYLMELQYWYCRRDAIRYVQAYVRGQIDFMRRNATSNRTMTTSARQDSIMNATGAEDATSQANRSSSSRYSDLSNSSGLGSSTGSRNLLQDSNGNGSMTDTGRGSNSVEQHSTFYSSSTINASSCDAAANNVYHVRMVTDGKGQFRPGFHQRINSANKTGLVVTTGLNYSETDTTTDEKDYGVIRDEQSRRETGKSVARVSDSRINNSNQPASQSSASHFYANFTTLDHLLSGGSSHTTSSSTATYGMTGSGSGSMSGSGSGGSSMTAGSTRTASASGEAHRLSVAASDLTSTMEKLHQRFLHLQDLWDKCTEMINWFEKQRLSIPAYVIQQITIQYPDGLNAAAANQMLIRTPYGAPRVITG